MTRAVAFGAVIAALAAGFLMIDWLVAKMLYYPEPGVALRADEAPVPVEEVLLTTGDGVRIHSFYLPAPGSTRALLFLHGNAGNASHRLPNAVLLQRTGTNVLLLDYRGYGLSEGTPHESGLYEDARTGLAHLLEERGFDPGRGVLFGRSLGGAVAVELARNRDLGGVILESTFPSLSAVASRHFSPIAGWLVPGRYDSEGKIAEARAPLLFFHGDRDQIVPYDQGVQLFEAAPEPKDFEMLLGAGHNDTVQVGGPRYLARIVRFLEQVTPAETATSSR
jgi:fermentation-respiration switch protein FrsA (DUF1100 family)